MAATRVASVREFPGPETAKRISRFRPIPARAAVQSELLGIAAVLLGMSTPGFARKQSLDLRDEG
jgi:hypothetical protein